MDKILVQQMKELVEKGKKKGKVLPVEEAFKMFPVEEEAHKGKIDYWIKEENKK